MGTAGHANTLPKSNAALLQKTSTKKVIHIHTNKPARTKNTTIAENAVIMGAENVSDERVAELLK